MYKFKDYINRGLLLLNNKFFPSRKKLSTIMIYATDLCNARCKHCFIWEKKPKQSLPLEQIKKIVHSKAVTKNTMIGLEGGEFILHPEYKEIIKYLKENHPNFDLLSNCVNPDRLIETVKQYTPKRLFMSLDGNEKTHDEIRGVNGLLPKVVRVIEELKDVVPISVMFTLTPFNTFDDLKYVADICKKNNVDMRVGIYNNMEYFETKASMTEAPTLQYSVDQIPQIVKQFEENYDFMVLYTNYRDGYVKLPCNSIKDSIVIYPNGDIPICQNKEIILGNLYKEPLHKIVNKKATRKLHKQHYNCNGCWINFHRKYDIVLYRSIEKVLPKRLIELFFGKYAWDKNPRKKYSQLVK